MNHRLIRPRGGTYAFRMKTPPSLVGAPNPWTGKPFGSREIKLGLGTKDIREARRLREMRLGEIRGLDEGRSPSIPKRGDWTVATIQAVRAERDREAAAIGPGDYPALDDVREEELERSVSSKKLSLKAARKVSSIAAKKTHLLSEVVEGYLSARVPGNPDD